MLVSTQRVAVSSEAVMSLLSILFVYTRELVCRLNVRHSLSKSSSSHHHISKAVKNLPILQLCASQMTSFSATKLPQFLTKKQIGVFPTR